MVLTPPELALLVLLPLVLGAALLRALGIGFATDRLAFGGWCWLVGTLVLAALELARLVTGMRSPGAVVAGALAVALVALALGRRTPAVSAASELACEPRSARLFLVGVVGVALVVVASRALGADWTAVVREDEALFWSRRAKLWFVAGGFGEVYARHLGPHELPNAGYPFLNPLLQLWAFDLAGRITHVVNRVPLQLCSLALVVCTAAALRRAAGAWLAGAFVLVLVSTPAAAHAVRHANSDVLVALGGVVALDAFLRARRQPCRAWHALAGLAAAFLVWSKNEGLLILAAFACAHVLVVGPRASLRPARALAWWLPAALVLAVTCFHDAWFRTSSNHAPWVGGFAGLGANLGRDLAVTLAAFARVAFASYSGGALVAFLVLAGLAPAARRGPLAVVTLALVFVLAGLVAVYVGKEQDPTRLLENTLERVLFQLVPLELVWLAALARALGADLHGADFHAADLHAADLPDAAATPGRAPVPAPP